MNGFIADELFEFIGASIKSTFYFPGSMLAGGGRLQTTARRSSTATKSLTSNIVE